MRLISPLAILLVVSQSTLPALPETRARSLDRLIFNITKTPEKISVDGVLDEASWGKAARIPLDYEIFPGNNTASNVKTTCLITLGATDLYFAFVASDPNPAEIRAYISDRDNLAGHDRVALILDPFNDGRRAFDFAVSALGVQFDGVFDQKEGETDASWDAIWNSAGRITEEGYVVEAAIPFKSLRFPEGKSGQTWGFFARRFRPRSQEFEMRSMSLDRDNSCELCQMNLLRGFEGISPGSNLQLTPFVTSARTDRREELSSSDLQNGDFDSEIGLDFRWGLTSNTSLNATINPDFSQVEADVAQLAVNNPFELLFEEKRPFFLEGADFFNLPIRAVFTRTISEPRAGAKLTGKMGKQAVGVLIAQDDVTNILMPGPFTSATTSLNQRSTTGVFRVRRDIGASSNIGVIYSGREGDDYYNRVAGIDAFLRPLAPLTLQLHYLRTWTAYPDLVSLDFGQKQGSFSGEGMRAVAEYKTREWEINGTFHSLDPDFRTDAGFNPQIDIRTLQFNATRTFWGDQTSWMTQLEFWAGYWPTFNFNGRLVNSWLIPFSFNYKGPLQTSWGFWPRWRRERFEGVTHTLYRPTSTVSIRPNGDLELELGVTWGENMDFRNARKADFISLRPKVELRGGRRVNLQLSHNLERLSVAGVRIVKANLAQLRAVYNFSHRAFVRGILQYREVSRNPDLHRAQVDRKSRNLFTQFLFSYKLNPQSVFFLGYSDNRSGFTDERFEERPLTKTDRTFFLKMAYAWRP